MKTIAILLFALAPAALAAQAPASGEPPVVNGKLESLSPAGGLEAALREARSRGSQPVWVGYSVPMVAGMGRVCCFSSKLQPAVCRLEGKNNGWGSNRDQARQDQDLHVLLRYQDGKLSEIRGFSQDCQLDVGGRRFVWLGPVKPEQSVSVLAEIARTGGDRHDQPGDEAISTLALHRNANADAVLEALASSRHSFEKREQALFWMGQTRGERGARYLEGVIRDEDEEDLREKAIFSLSQSHVPWAAETIAQTARHDRSGKIRGEALFWLAQMDSAAQAPETILEAITKDPDRRVRKKAVFALSQLDDGEAVTYLVRVGKESRDPEIRKEAFFWLAQSNEPKALEYLDRVLNGPGN